LLNEFSPECFKEISVLLIMANQRRPDKKNVSGYLHLRLKDAIKNSGFDDESGFVEYAIVGGLLKRKCLTEEEIQELMNEGALRATTVLSLRLDQAELEKFKSELEKQVQTELEKQFKSELEKQVQTEVEKQFRSELEKQFKPELEKQVQTEPEEQMA
jgi:hypothetical protein